MKAFLDAPLLIYLNTVRDSERLIYEDFFIDLISQRKLYTDPLVLDELIYVSKKKYGIPYNVTLEFIDSVILPYVILLKLGEEEYLASKEFLLKYKVKPSDALHLGVMKVNGINVIVSEDGEFDKVNGIERLWI